LWSVGSAPALARRERIPVESPWLDLVALGTGALGAVLVAAGLSLVVLRAGTDMVELRTE
jgi:hypothetical protein